MWRGRRREGGREGGREEGRKGDGKCPNWRGSPVLTG